MTNVKKILIVVCPEGFRDEEYLEPRSVLEQDGHKVSVASLKLGQAKGVNGALA